MASLLRYTAILATVSLLLFLMACTVRVTATPVPTETPAPIKHSTSVPPTRIPLPDPGLSNSEIVAAITQYPEIIDAAINERGNQVSLVLIVHPLTNESRGKELGDNFVRMFKSFSDDEAPGSSIGTGKYDYLIGVYYPNKKKVAQGTKSRVAQRISW